MLICPRCTTQNADWSAQCHYCAAPFGPIAAQAPLAVAPPQPAWAPQPHVFQGVVVPQSAWRDGKQLVLHHGAPLPARCVKCNAPAHGRPLERKLTWLHPAYLLICLTGFFIVYAILFQLIGKKADVYIGLCERHKKQRWLAIAGGWTFGLIGFVGLPAIAIAFDLPWLAGVGFLLFLVALIGSLRIARVVRVRKMDDYRVWLSGVHPEYLSALPPPPPYG